jgi:hypothetical protein
MPSELELQISPIVQESLVHNSRVSVLSLLVPNSTSLPDLYQQTYHPLSPTTPAAAAHPI